MEKMKRVSPRPSTFDELLEGDIFEKYPGINEVGISLLAEYEEEYVTYLYGYEYDMKDHNEYMYLDRKIHLLPKSFPIIDSKYVKTEYGINDPFDDFGQREPGSDPHSYSYGLRGEPLALEIRKGSTNISDIVTQGDGTSTGDFISIGNDLFVPHGKLVSYSSEGSYYSYIEVRRYNYGIIVKYEKYLESYMSNNYELLVEINYRNLYASEVLVYNNSLLLAIRPDKSNKKADTSTASIPKVIQRTKIEGAYVYKYVYKQYKSEYYLTEYSQYVRKMMTLKNEILPTNEDELDEMEGFRGGVDLRIKKWKEEPKTKQEYGLSQVGIEILLYTSPIKINHFLEDREIDSERGLISRYLYYRQFDYINDLHNLFPKVVSLIIIDYLTDILDRFRNVKEVLSYYPDDIEAKEELFNINKLL